MKLYQSNGSPNSRRVRIYLAEKGISMAVVPVDLDPRPSSDMSHPRASTNRSVVLTSRRRLRSRAACCAGDILSQ